MGSDDLLRLDGLELSKIPDLRDVPLGELSEPASDADDKRPQWIEQWIEMSAAPVTMFNSSI